ncbi:MAG: glycoside hydrolase family 27 protein [bacterium]
MQSTVMRLALAAIVVLASLQSRAHAADVLAPTPPMGWNSWDCYGTTVTEDEVKANADFMARHLKKHGWQYVVVDIQWSETNPKSHGYRENAVLAMDSYGRLIPAVNRFPSSAEGRGFKPLADYVHSLGLKFGIHIMRGIPRQAVRANTPILGTTLRAADIANPQSICRWNTDMYGIDMSKPGAQEYYDSIVRMYADWGVDFIKADDMLRPLHKEEVAALHRAIQKTGRPIVLSLSPGPAKVEDAEFLASHAQMWRVSDDFWDNWKALRHAFDLIAPWSGKQRPGAWPDGDMLPLGHIGIRAERGDDRQSLFTRDEQRTVMSLWSIARSPLMFGGDLPTSEQYAIELITNDEVLAVNQQGANPRELFRRGNQIAWVSDAPQGGKFLAVFNVGDSGDEEIRVELKELGLSGKSRVRDLWTRQDIGVFDSELVFRIPVHGSGLYRVTPE